MVRQLLISLFGVFFSTSACAESTSGANTKPSKIQVISVSEAAALLAGDDTVILLDIRTAEEYAGGHIDGAVNIDFHGRNFEGQIRQLDRHKIYIVHCHSGVRSGKSMRLFKRNGFTDIRHLKSGIAGWRRAKLPETAASG